MGETVAIMGASGAGKSTLLGLLAGLDLPTSGNIWLKDCDITKKDEDSRAELRARNVGFIFQSFHLLPSLNAIENVMLPLELADSDRAKERAREILKDVGLGQRLYHYPSQLSGGEKQRVAIARAFVCKPTVLFADEPTGNLDAKTGEKISSLMFDLNHNAKTTLVIVTHDQSLAKKCDRKLHLSAGLLLSEELVSV